MCPLLVHGLVCSVLLEPSSLDSQVVSENQAQSPLECDFPAIRDSHETPSRGCDREASGGVNYGADFEEEGLY